MKNYLCLLLAISGTAEGAVYRTHTVSTGETLSQILYDYNLRPIYTKDGSLNNTVFANTELLQKSGDLIFPGQRIKLYESGTDVIEEVPVRSELYSENQRSPQRIGGHSDRNTLTVSLLSGYLGVLGEDQNGQTGEALSKIYFGLAGKWERKFFKNYGITFSLDYIDLEIGDAINATLANRKQSLKKVGIAFDRNFSWINLELGYNLRDQIFYRTVSSNSFQISTMINNQIYLQGEKDVYELNNALISLGLSANFNKFSAFDGVDVSDGPGFGAFIKYGKRKKEKSLAAILGYETSSFKSSDTDMDYNVLSLRFDYEFDF